MPKLTIVGTTKDAPIKDERGGFLLKGLADGLLAPIDLLTWPGRAATEAFTGRDVKAPSTMTADLLRGMGLPVAPEGMQPTGYAENLAYGSGAGIGGIAPVAAGANLLGTGGRLAAQNPVIRGIADDLIQPYVTNTKRALGIDALAAGGAGLGMGVGEDVAKSNQFDEPTAEMIGGLIGGFAAPMGVVGAQQARAATMRGAGALGSKLIGQKATERVKGFGESVSEAFTGIFNPTKVAGLRASKRLKAALPKQTREQALEAATSEDTILGLSVAEKTGEPEMLRLEQALRASDPEFDAAMTRLDSQRMQAAEEAITAPGEGMSSAEIRQAAEDYADDFRAQIDARVAQALEAAEGAAEAAGPRTGALTGDLSVIFRTELEAALEDARIQERQLWDAVPEVEDIVIFNTRKTKNEIFRDASDVDLPNIPSEIKTYLDPESAKYIGDYPSSKDLTAFASEMRQIVRANSGPEGNRKTRRYASMIADAIEKDLMASEPLREALTAAKEMTRQVNDVFYRGNIGKVLATTGGSQTNQPRVAPENTLTTLFGNMRGTDAAVTTRQAEAAVGGSRTAAQAADEYMRGLFEQAMIGPEGQLTPRKAGQFMAQREDVMTKYPVMKRMFDEAISKARGAEKAAAEGEAALATDPSLQAARVVMKSKVGKEFDSVMRSGNPAFNASEVRAIAEEVGPDAVTSLRAASADWLLGRISSESAQSGTLLKGTKLREVLSDSQVYDALAEVHTPEYMDNLVQLSDELIRMQEGREVTDNVELLLRDVTDIVSEQLAGFAGLKTAEAVKPTGAAALSLASRMSSLGTKLVQRLRSKGSVELLKAALADESGATLEALVNTAAATQSRRLDAANRLALILVEQAAATGAKAGSLSEGSDPTDEELLMQLLSGGQPSAGPLRIEIPNPELDPLRLIGTTR